MIWNRWVWLPVMVSFCTAAPRLASAQSVPSSPFSLLPQGSPDPSYGSAPAVPSYDAVDVPGRHQFVDLATGSTAAYPGPTPRHRGLGIPLQGTSWRNRPWYAGWQYGWLLGDDLVRGKVHQHSAATGGYWIGYDFNHYWGGEMQWSFAYPELYDSRYSVRRSARDVFWDFDLLYYPWGDARYRPYFKLGLGVTGVHFEDELGQYFNRGLVTVPLGFGVKYYWRKWLALRMDLTDRIAFGSGRVSTQGNWQIVFGVEARFGDYQRVLYHP